MQSELTRRRILFGGAGIAATVERSSWTQTDPDKGWVALLRLYSPMPAFFDKSWQPTEIEVVE